MAGTKIAHIPYKGSAPMLTDLLGGQVQVAFDNTVIPSIKGGKLRGLAVTGPVRLAALPDLPTAAEAGLPGYEAVGWMGLYAPRGHALADHREAVGRDGQGHGCARHPREAQCHGVPGQDRHARPSSMRTCARKRRSGPKVSRDANVQPE